MVGQAINSTIIRNCTVSNVKITKIAEEAVDSYYAGGLVGVFAGREIINCYATNIDISVRNVVNARVGGLIGTITTVGNIENCYTQGVINVNKQKVGGICGWNTSSATNIKNCYSYVKILSDEDYVGGILGQDSDTGTSNVSNNLSLGDIYVRKNSDMISRIVGNNLNKENNYAYNMQRINGYETTEQLGAKLLTYEELCKKNTYIDTIKLGDAYDYSKVSDGILPKLYNTNGTELLPNQEDIYINKEVELTIDNVTAEKLDSNTVNAVIEINNPSEVPITNIIVDDMECSIQKNNTLNGKTYIEIKAIPVRYYDGYKISKIIYENNGEKEKEANAKIGVQFFKDIYNYDDWQSIELGTYQNYRLINDIDFAGKDDVKTNITMSRLESNGKTLKNVTINAKGNYSGLIREITTEIKNVNFENITINNGYNYTGIIAKSLAEIDNINFKDITITSSRDYVGCIAHQSIGKVSNITLENIKMAGASYVGGLIGYNNNSVSNVKAVNIDINTTSNQSGGILGYAVGNYDYIKLELSDANIIGARKERKWKLCRWNCRNYKW